MTETAITLTLSFDEHADAEMNQESHADFLRLLREADLSVVPAESGRVTPDAAKGGELLTDPTAITVMTGSLALALRQINRLTQIWLNSESKRSVKLKVGDDSIEIQGRRSSADEQRLDDWIAARDSGGQ